MNTLKTSTIDSVKVTIVSDIVCPFCYIGYRNLQRASESSGIPLEIQWEPFLLDTTSTIPEEGVPLETVLAQKYGAAAAKLLLDSNSSLAQAGRAVGIEFKSNRNAYSTLKAHVLMEYVKSTFGNVAANLLMDRIFYHYFVLGDNISSDIVLQYIVSKMSMNIGNISTITSDVIRHNAVVQKDTCFKTKMNVTGVPFFTIELLSLNTTRTIKPISFSGVRPIDFITHALEEITEKSMIIEGRPASPTSTVIEVVTQI